MIAADSSLVSQLWSALTAHVTGGSVGIIGTLLFCTRYLRNVLKPLVQWASVFRIEHDILWEDFNIRTGGPYRRPESAGRGGYTGRHSDAPLPEPKSK